MRLSLVFPAWYAELGTFGDAAKKVSTFPPLNLCLVGALAEREGWQVQLVDAHIEQLDHEGTAQRVLDFGPDLVGVTATTPSFHNAVAFARFFKAKSAVPVAVGGTHVSLLRHAAFDECFDYLFVGECEGSFPVFLRRFASGERAPDVPGLLVRRGGEVHYGGDAPLVETLDDVPPPARHLLPNEKYVLGTLRGPKRYTSVQMTRGCPFSCVFCACELHGKRLRARSVDNVVRELECVVREFGAEHVYFVDDTLTLNRRYVLDLCDELEKRGLRFTFEGSTRANLWDEELAERLKRCGLIRISFGLESADPAVRDLIRKEVPLESYAAANRLSNRLGIETINSVIIGLPGDTRESIERTVDYLVRARDLLHVTLNIAVPYPGTEMFHMAEAGLHGLKLVESDFSRYQRYDSAVMEVGGIGPAELMALQKKALLRIYRKWWRFVPILRRFGFSSLVKTGARVVWSLIAHPAEGGA